MSKVLLDSRKVEFASLVTEASFDDATPIGRTID